MEFLKGRLVFCACLFVLFVCCQSFFVVSFLVLLYVCVLCFFCLRVRLFVFMFACLYRTLCSGGCVESSWCASPMVLCVSMCCMLCMCGYVPVHVDGIVSRGVRVDFTRE
jgi:hypothetical protein